MCRGKPVAFFKVRNIEVAELAIKEKNLQNFDGRTLDVKIARGRANWVPKNDYNPNYGNRRNQNNRVNYNWYAGPQVKTV